MTPFILICGIISFLCCLLVFVLLCRIQGELNEANERVAELEALLEEKSRKAKMSAMNLSRIEGRAKDLQRAIYLAKEDDAKPNDSVWKSSVTRINIIP